MPVKVSHLQAGDPTTQVDIAQMNTIEVTKMFNQIMNTRSQHNANINHKLNYIKHLARLEYRQKGRRKYERIILTRSGDIELNPGPKNGVSKCHKYMLKEPQDGDFPNMQWLWQDIA